MVLSICNENYKTTSKQYTIWFFLFIKAILYNILLCCTNNNNYYKLTTGDLLSVWVLIKQTSV